MINQSSRNSLIAISVLAGAVILVGSIVYKSNFSIQASSQISSVSSKSTPLKTGWNSLTNGPKTITFKSRVITINGSLISIEEAKLRGVIDSVANEKNGTILGDKDKVLPKEGFAVFVKDTTLSPSFYPEEI